MTTSGPPPRDRRREELGDLSDGTMTGMRFRVVRAFLLAILRLTIGLKIRGTENMPKSGGVLIVANHLHNADPLVIAVACPRSLHYMAKRELFDVPVLGRMLRYGGSFPIDRGHPDRWAIRRSEETLRQGIVLGMFPEGTRSTTGSMKKALAGAGLIGLRGNAPIVPVAVMGTEHLPFNGTRPRVAGERRLRGSTVIFGAPFELPREIDGKRLSAEEASEFMMRRVAALLPPRYRGLYGDSPAETVSGEASESPTAR